MACGISPAEGAIIFRQSAVREHTELAWLLACVTPLGWLTRMTQYKQKAGSARDASSLGLLSYPVLQAADILLYRATHVPVGEDQHQHLELSRDIAAMFNRRYYGAPEGTQGNPGGRRSGSGSVSSAAIVTLDDVFRDGSSQADGAPATSVAFPLPTTVTVGSVGAPRVMSLRDATRKMSKSDSDDGSRINLTDSADMIADKMRRAKTDSQHGFAAATLSAEKANLLSIFGAVSGCSVAEAAARFEDSTAAAFKAELADLLVATITPIGDEMRRLLADGADSGGGAVNEALTRGEDRAREIASGVMRDVRAAVGAS